MGEALFHKRNHAAAALIDACGSAHDMALGCNEDGERVAWGWSSSRFSVRGEGMDSKARPVLFLQ